ncbi:unnamed protein product [Phytomonas sp. EM1]|nr:unnamed protein product [Phytomonas sp. EM1]|eukprot:CCW62276.1 unnamed protein product [Phytomonas sp. isolate EM1]
MAVVADHSTPVELGDHCCEPVPVSVATKPLLVHHGHCPNGLHGEEDGKGRNGEWFAFQDGVQYYSENLVSEKGGLGRFRGEALLPLLKRANAYYHYYP